jgi:hypothetical protein
MLTLAVLATGAAALVSLPCWLPGAIVALRMRIFIHVNGEEGISIPGPLVGASQFERVYSDPAAGGRSRGAALSDLFWYWLSPGPEIHQEHLEAGERYEEIAHTTRRILALSRKEAEELTARCLGRLAHRLSGRALTLVRLRDWLMPAWAEFYYELVFGDACPAETRALIVAHARDVVTALKCTGLRHMSRRHRLTRFLVRRLETGGLPHALPERLSTGERALYLQGVFFNTGVVQTSEAMAHLLMALAQHQDVQARVAETPGEERYLDHVIDETLRLYPLFGISHRITTDAIVLDDRSTISRGSVLCFNHPEYHLSGFDRPDTFDPDRWETLSARQANYIPFGVAGNRPCPASGLMPMVMRAATRELLARFAFYTSASHTRSIPNRGPCLVASRAHPGSARQRRALLAFMKIRDRWEDVWRSLVQLFLGSYMVWDARRLHLCRRYFEGEVAESACPFSAATRGRSAGAESGRQEERVQ